MRFPIKTVIFLSITGGIIAAGYFTIPSYLKALRKKDYRQDTVSRGPIVSVVNATGTVKPVLSVSVGAFVSGPILELSEEADFNKRVYEGQILAKIDPKLYQANVNRDKAQRDTRKAELERAKVEYNRAKNNEERALKLHDQNPKFISEAEMDQFRFDKEAAKAQVDVAKYLLEQAEAALANSEANLFYTDIKSPVDGIIIDRKIDKGQTLASQFQTPELFIIAPKMEEKMYIHASIDEADIGLIKKAEKEGLPVQFTVDAYPNELFDKGKIFQIRMSSTETQNVVTYPVVVETPNPGMKLMPGTTASLSFEVDSADNVLRIPNAALRFYPDRELVRPEDRKILDGTKTPENDDEESQTQLTAAEKAEGRRNQNRRHVWVVDGEYLKAIEVITGISNYKHTAVVSGDLKEGMKLVTGIQSPR